MTGAATDVALDALATSLPLTEVDRAEVAEVLREVETLMAGWQLGLEDDRRLALAAHSLAFARRVRTGEALPAIDPTDFPEIPRITIEGLREALLPYCAVRETALADEEVFLFAMHVEVARLRV